MMYVSIFIKGDGQNMSFELPYKTLTPILGEKATYDPKEETTPEFMNGKFEELLENDKSLKNQINVLNDKCVIPEEDRDSNTKPSDYVNGFRVRGLRKTLAVGILDRDAYAHIIGYNFWRDNTARVHELAFVDGNLYTRMNLDLREGGEGYDEWGEWDRLVKASEIQALQQQLSIISNMLMETSNLNIE